jgi:hypothetical protein
MKAVILVRGLGSRISELTHLILWHLMQIYSTYVITRASSQIVAIAVQSSAEAKSRHAYSDALTASKINMRKLNDALLLKFEGG